MTRRLTLQAVKAALEGADEPVHSETTRDRSGAGLEAPVPERAAPPERRSSTTMDTQTTSQPNTPTPPPTAESEPAANRPTTAANRPTTADVARSAAPAPGNPPQAQATRPRGGPPAPNKEADGRSTSETGASSSPLFDGDEASALRGRWQAVQTGFVDEPRHAVEKADGLVAEVMQKLAMTFADERSALERQWSRGAEVSTEDLRIALQRYRTFFDRLLSI